MSRLTHFTHDDSFKVFNHDEHVGDIDFRLSYSVTSWGRPEQGPSFASAGEPAEGPEIEVIRVSMALPKNHFGQFVYIDAFPWLDEWVREWADLTTDELVEAAGEKLQARAEANMEARADEIREERR